MAHRSKQAAKAKADPAPLTLVKAFDVVCEMENDVLAIKAFADALEVMAEALDEREGGAVQHIAWTIKARAEAIEERRGNLFRSLHQNRHHFEKVGWPDGKVVTS